MMIKRSRVNVHIGKRQMNDDGTVTCPRCQGDGKTYYSYMNDMKIYRAAEICTKCDGHGYLDWIENIVGKRLRFV